MTITFRASLPPIKSAILLDGLGDGGQVKLEVPRSDVGALLLLQHEYSGKTFTVTIEIAKQTEANGEPELETRRKRQSRWQTTEGEGAN